MSVRHILIAALLLSAGVFAIDLTDRAAIIVQCVAILVLGLPHGTFDFDLLRRAKGKARIALLASYLGLAALMFGLWTAAPVLALAIFYSIAALHFAEDWQDAGGMFFAHATAIALVAAPAVFHADEVRALFVALTGDDRAAVLADLLLMICPVTAAVAAVGIANMVDAGRRRAAIDAVIGIAAMLLLPPVAGFTVFFCLIHSPIAFGDALRQRSSSLGAAWPVVVALTLGALGIAVGVYLTNVQVAVSNRLFASAFETLSILTLPHLALPLLMQALASARQTADATTRAQQRS